MTGYAHARLDLVVTDPPIPAFPPSLFGEEPPHDWCYYFQKAELAWQRGSWHEVVALWKEAEQLGLGPNDESEKFVFASALSELEREHGNASAERDSR